MLRKIPDSAVPFARDGVIAASALGRANGAERVERFAQKRAAQILADAQRQAQAMQAQAREDGYRDGLERALACVVPPLAELLADEVRLKSAVREEMQGQLRRWLTDAGLEAALITQCCSAEPQEASAPAWTLYVPADRAELLERLSAQTASGVLRVRTGDALMPVLERGDRVIELNTTELAQRQLSTWLDAQTLAEALNLRATHYATTVGRSLSVNATRAHLAQLDKEGLEP